MNKNQKGFSTVEILIILLVIVLIVGVGRYVWQSKSESGQNGSTQRPETDPAQNNEPNRTEENSSSNGLPFTYTAPTGWESEVFSEGDVHSVTLRAPGTKTEDGAFAAVIQGAEIYLICNKTAYTSLEQFKKEDSRYTQSASAKQDITVNQNQAVQYVAGYEGPERRITTFFIGPTECDASIEENVFQKPEFSTAYKQLIATIEF